MLPLFLVGGLNGAAIPTLYAGGTVVLEPPFEPENALTLIRKEKITFLGGVPLMFRMMRDAPGFDTADLRSIERVMCDFQVDT